MTSLSILDEANITLTDTDFTIKDSKGCSIAHQAKIKYNNKIEEELPRLFNDPSIFCAEGEEFEGIDGPVIGQTCPGDSGKL